MSPGYALAPYVGSGRPGDLFRPRTDQPYWRAIDLRPDATRLEGYALLVTPERELGHVDLGPSPDDRWSLRSLSSRLGVTLERGNLRAAAADLLIAQARTDGTRWRPLWPERDGAYRIWLGGLLWAMPVLAGGASLADTFTAGDNATLTGDLVWTETGGAWETFSNQARMIGTGTAVMAICNTPLDTVNQFAQFTVASYAFTSGTLVAVVVCRKTDAAATPLTYYSYNSQRSATENEHRLNKTIAGTTTLLGTDPTDIANGQVLYVEANGSAITSKLSGAVSVGPITDTAIDGTTVGGKFVGMRAFGNAGGGTVIVDTFTAADIAAQSATGIPYQYYYAGRAGR